MSAHTIISSALLEIVIVTNPQLPRVLTLASNGRNFFRVTDITNHLGYQSSIPISKLRSDYKCNLYRFAELVPNKLSQKQLCAKSHQYTASGLRAASQFTDNDGLNTIVQRCNRKSAAITTCANLNIISSREHCIQAQIEHLLIPYFKHWNIQIEHEKTVLVNGYRFRIDMCLPQFKIAIEIDENGHRDRDPVYEKNRQQLLETMGFIFIRMNPHHISQINRPLDLIVAHFWRTGLYPMLVKHNAGYFSNDHKSHNSHKTAIHTTHLVAFIISKLIVDCVLWYLITIISFKFNEFNNKQL